MAPHDPQHPVLDAQTQLKNGGSVRRGLLHSDATGGLQKVKRLAGDPWVVGALVFFVAAAGFAALPIAEAARSQVSLVMLLVGLAGVTLIGIFAFGAAEARLSPEGQRPDLLIHALEEPAALAHADGRLSRANDAWIKAGGEDKRLPRGDSAPALYAAMAQARSGKPGRAVVRLGHSEYEMLAASVGQDLYLVRAVSVGVLGPDFMIEQRPSEDQAQGLIDAKAVGEIAAGQAAEGAKLDPFAQKAPFGAARLWGGDLLTASLKERNGAFDVLTKQQALEGQVFGDLIVPSWREEVRTKAEMGKTGPIDVRLSLDAERPFQIYLVGEGEDRLIYLLDVTGQKQVELQLAQAQKMQAIGQLAGGVAHDFNNLLTAIQLRLDELLQRHPVGDPSYEGLNEIRQTGVRAADLVRKLLAFSRKQTVKRETLELGELISEFEVLLRRLLREDVKLETSYGRDLPYVHADKSQLETAVMNLAVNARDAMRAQGGGTVKIRTKRLSQEEAISLGWANAPAMDCALIEVSDTGPGILPELQAKIFEPFFTTKAIGEGTGMGLATVYGIVEQADGHIALYSKAGEGAHFRVFLPAYQPAADQEIEAPKPKAEKPVAKDLSGAGKILFVEDEDAVRGVAARLLRARGYEVIEAADGEEALYLAETHAGEINMLISDVIMPGLDGPTFLKKARPFLGGVPVMFISGYAESEFSDLLEDEPDVSFLPKPLDIKTLAERVKQALHGG